MKSEIKKLKIVIPAAGIGSRFKIAGYNDLKPFIKINGVTMIEHVINGFHSNKFDVEIHIIMQEQQLDNYNAEIINIKKRHQNVSFHSIKNKTEGTICTILSLYEILNEDSMLLSANCDQLANITLDEYIEESINFDGSLLVFPGETSPNWSFVKIENGYVVNVADKNPISDIALLGWYFWKSSLDFLKYSIRLIVENIRTNGEFMQNLPYNFAIKDGKKIKPILVSKNDVFGLGTPEELDEYIKKHC